MMMSILESIRFDSESKKSRESRLAKEITGGQH